MSAHAKSRGGPLIALCAILSLWIVTRVTLAGYDTAVELPAAPISTGPIALIENMQSRQDAQALEWAEVATTNAVPSLLQHRFVPVPARRDGPAMAPIAHQAQLPVPHLERNDLLGASAGHRAWEKGVARLPLPDAIAEPMAAAPNPALSDPVERPAQRGDRRWSADSWVLLRAGGSPAPATGVVPSTYGASQAGAVVRYRVARSSAHRPETYLRGAAALQDVAEKEVALGISARPVPTVPLRASVELRVSDLPMGEQLRPAAMVVTEVQPIDLSNGTRLEIYGQAGYVGGNFDTSFVDAQMRGDAFLTNVDDGELRVGGGAWVGAQRGTSRVDIGPTATLGLPIGQGVSARIGLDWRMRVAGDAEPGTGPALTLSAGF